MKTSNKLLIGLVLLLFSLPLILMMGFKAAVKNNHYVVRSNTGYEVSEPKEVKAFTAIKLNGNVPASNDIGLRTNIIYGEKFGYSINNYNENHPEEGRIDSCRISWAGDTIVVNYDLKAFDKINSSNYFNGVEIDITIPHAVPVIANGATVIVNIDTSAVALGAMSFQLSNGAILNVERLSADQWGRMDDQSLKKFIKLQTLFSDITINANNASIKIADQVNIKNLKLNLNGKSTVNFSEAVAIDTLSGHISEASFFNAPYRFSKFLK
ncbi:hypothetical protein ACLOAU_08795 [Niabella sp. CJ426]|uniref:hypothetical protein n=1 Tax=Niabella sp. CJ426 TaxID=3393740 RepID=UPI003D05B002